MRFLGLVILVACCLTSCEKQSEFEGNQPIDPNGWKSSEPVHFEFETHDTIQLHNFYIDVRNREDYAFSNIFFFAFSLSLSYYCFSSYIRNRSIPNCRFRTRR